jgi:cell division septation protein DedD
MKKKCCETAMGKIEKVLELLNDLKKTQFTGFIRINYSQGGITRIEKNEEILKKAQLQK